MALNFAKHIQIISSKIEQWVNFYLRRKTKPFIYVALGDSAVEGVGASKPARSYTGIIHEHLKIVKKHTIYHNFGKSFAKVSDILETQMERTIAAQPDLITISIGANDLKQHTSLRNFERDLETLLKTLKKETNAEIIINNIPSLVYAPAIPRHLRIATGLAVSRINAIIKKQAEKTHVILVDVYKQSLVFVRDYPEVVSEDGFHPSDFGYAIWANTIISEIKHLSASPDSAHFR